MGQRRCAFHIRSVSVRSRVLCSLIVITDCRSIFISPACLMLPSHIPMRRDTAPGQTEVDVAFFFVSFILIESIMLLNVRMLDCVCCFGARTSNHHLELVWFWRVCVTSLLQQEYARVMDGGV